MACPTKKHLARACQGEWRIIFHLFFVSNAPSDQAGYLAAILLVKEDEMLRIGMMMMLAWLGLIVGAGCEDGDTNSGGGDPTDTTTDSDSDTGTDPSSTDPLCDQAGGQLGDVCDLDALCDCDHLCGYQLWSEKQDGGKAVAHQCYARCEVDGAACDGPQEACVPRGKQPAVCLPTGQLSIPSFEIKVFAQGAKTTASDLVQGDNLSGSLGGRTLPTGYADGGVVTKDNKNVVLAFLIAEPSATQMWLLEVILPAGKWKPGTYKVGGFSATLLRSELGPKGAVQKTFYEASAAAGTLTLSVTPQPCTESEGCPVARGGLSLDLLGLPTELQPKP